jgi:hypothetical protein
MAFDEMFILPIFCVEFFMDVRVGNVRVQGDLSDLRKGIPSSTNRYRL